MVRYRSHSIEFKRQACSRVPGRRAPEGARPTTWHFAQPRPAMGCKVRGRRARRGGRNGAL